MNLVRLMQIPDQVDRPDLKYRPFAPGVPPALVKRPDMFAAIRKGDILLHHPFQSFKPVINFIEQAALRIPTWSRSSRRCIAPAPTPS